MRSSPQISVIISEYNPFHLGHAYHIAQTRRQGASHIVALLSGDFVQRGEPALFSKWARAEMALSCGVDLVLELPLPWSMATAERFAYGGVYLANALGCAHTLSFGSECGDLALLQQAAQAVEKPAVMAQARRLLASGLPFAKARQQAVAAQFGPELAEVLRSPNNTLAVEYLKALRRLQSPIQPVTICRAGAAHDSDLPAGGTASASFLRQHLLAGERDVLALMPPAAARCAENALNAGLAPVQMEPLELAILAKLRTMKQEDFQRLPDISEGLEHRIYRAARTCASLKDLYENIKTKRYTLARIRRIIVSAFLGMDNLAGAGAPPYLRVLGFTKGEGETLLRRVTQTARLPVVVRASDVGSLREPAESLFRLEARAADLYGLASPQIQPCGTEYTTPVLKVDAAPFVFFEGRSF